MNRILYFLMLMGSSVLGIFGQNIAFEPSTSLLLKNCNYLDIDQGRFVQGDIYIEDGIIKDIQSAIPSSRGEIVQDLSGQWLIPGLIDAHIHLFQSGGLYTRPDAIDLTHLHSYKSEIQWLKDNAADILSRYLSIGITTVIDLGGPTYNMHLRDSLRGSTLHPNLWITGPLISTYQPKEFEIHDPPIIKAHNKQEAIRLVQDQLEHKPDFIKIWYISLPNQSAESTYDIIEAVISESHRHALKVAVHATQLNTAKLAIKAGADILVHSVAEPIDEDFIQMLGANNVIYIPTLVVSGNYTKVFGQTFKASPEDLRYAPPIPLGSLYDVHHLKDEPQLSLYAFYYDRMASEDHVMDSIKAGNLKILIDHNITVATGTDAGNIGTMHGSSYYDEIYQMHQAGLTNLQILKASTINGAKVLAKDNAIGSIQIGKIADLVILNSNPLHDLNALKNIASIIKGGQLLIPQEIVSTSPADLVQMQLNAYNTGDLEAFLYPYAEDVRLYDYSDALWAQSKEEMRSRYARLFEEVPALHCQLINRMILGNTVIDQERVMGFANGHIIEAIAIYKVANGKISEVRFIKK